MLTETDHSRIYVCVPVVKTSNGPKKQLTFLRDKTDRLRVNRKE
jgi:hypothetical protein